MNPPCKVNGGLYGDEQYCATHGNRPLIECIRALEEENAALKAFFADIDLITHGSASREFERRKAEALARKVKP